MPEIRFSVDEEQYAELSKLKAKRGLTWKGLMLTGADQLTDDIAIDSPAAQRFPGLTYDADQDRRVFPEPADDRLGAFKGGWTKATNGETFQSSTYETLSWHNLGWRLGRLFDYNPDHDTSGHLKRELYMWCVEQQREAADTD